MTRIWLERYPGLVKKIESYIERYSPQEKKFIIAALE